MLELTAFQPEIESFICRCISRNRICKVTFDFAIPGGNSLWNDRVYISGLPQPFSSNGRYIFFDCLFRNTISGATATGKCRISFDGNLLLGVQDGEFPFGDINRTESFNEVHASIIYAINE